ncbi:MAG: CehA/McbA family metallohydrolase [SAR202 cluster bacterium]|nr:CehA/McbA family metallohydrolase [SAR202 cluster bacterium]
MAVFDLHVHTVKGSSDSSLTPVQLIAEASRIGLDGVCLTEHGGGWENPELAAAFGESGITVIPALEVDTEMGHVLVFGMRRYVPGMHKIGELRRVVNRAGGVMISAHPFRNLFNKEPYNTNLLYRNGANRLKTAIEASRHPLFEVVDEIEVVNGSNTSEENAFALEVARNLGLPGAGGSDVHSTHGLGRCVTVFDSDVRSESDLVEAIKARAYRPGEEYNTGNLRTI